MVIFVWRITGKNVCDVKRRQKYAEHSDQTGHADRGFVIGAEVIPSGGSLGGAPFSLDIRVRTSSYFKKSAMTAPELHAQRSA